MSFNCKLPKKHFKRDKITWTNDPGYLNDIDRRLQSLWKNLAKVSPVAGGDAKKMDALAKNLFMARHSSVANLSAVYRVNPGNVSRGWANFWARNFAMARKKFGSSEHFTEIGAVRSNLSGVAKKWAGSVSDAIAEVEAIQKVAKTYEAIDQIRAARKIPQSEWDELLADSLEVGWQPFAKDYMGLTDRSAAFLGAAQKDLFERFQDLGLSGEEIKAIVKGSSQVAETYHEVLNIGRRAGLQIGDVAPLGYMPRQFSPDMLKRFDFEWRGKVAIDNNGVEITQYEALQKARENFNYVLEDEVLLDALLRSNDPDIYKKISRQSKKQITGVGDLIDSKYGVTDALLNYLNENQLNLLTEQGLLSKIPMRTTEIYDQLKKGMRLPYKGLNELLATDWREGVRIYSERLMHMASDSGQTWALARNAIDKQWGVTKAEFFREGGLTGKYKGWIPLTEAIPKNIRTKFGLQQAATEGTAFKTFEDIYVPRTIADLYGSMLDLSTDPYKLGILDHLVELTRKPRSALQIMYIMSTGFGVNQVIQNAVQTIAATTTVGRNSLRSFSDFASNLGGFFQIAMSHPGGKDFTQWLPDTEKIFTVGDKKYTKRGLWRWAIKNGVIDHFVPGTTGLTRGQNYVPKDFNPAKQFRYLQNTFEQYGALATGEKVLQSSEFALSRAAAPFLWINLVTENAAKISALESMFRGNNPIAPEQAIDHLRRYFYDYGDIGDLDPVVGTFLPFWGFVGKNMNGSLRQIKQSPGLYANFLRLHAMSTSPSPAGFPEDSQASWLGESPPVWLEDNGKQYYFPIDNYVPVVEGVRDIGKYWLETLGLFPSGTGTQSLDYNLQHPPWEEPNAVNEMLSETFGIYQAAASLAAGKDIRTGRPFSNIYPGQLFGVDIAPQAKYLIDTLVPPIARLNKFYSNRVAIGAPTIAETPAGTIEISPGDGQSRIKVAKETQKSGWFEQMGSLLGVRGVDAMYAAGMKREDIWRTYQAGVSYYKKANREFERTNDPKRRDELFKNLVETRLALRYFREQFARFEQFRLSKGLHTNKALRELKDKYRMQIWQLPELPKGAREELEKEIQSDLELRYR